MLLYKKSAHPPNYELLLVSQLMLLLADRFLLVLQCLVFQHFITLHFKSSNT